jgi:hypothetical protein
VKVLFASILGVMAVISQAVAQPVLVTNAPTAGTFFLLGANPPLPFPFDPYFGALPVYAYDGVFFVDDSQVGDLQLQQTGFGGEMMLSSLPGPGPGIACTNCPTITNICSGPTNFTVAYQYAASGLALGIAPTTNSNIALTILTTTNTSYDLFGSTNMAALASPALSRTNWIWLKRATGGVTNFSWGETNWCERYFQLGILDDHDSDLLTSAYETLVSHTSTNLWDTDGDWIGDGVEVQFGLNPRVTDPAFTISITQRSAA